MVIDDDDDEDDDEDDDDDGLLLRLLLSVWYSMIMYDYDYVHSNIVVLLWSSFISIIISSFFVLPSCQGQRDGHSVEGAAQQAIGKAAGSVGLFREPPNEPTLQAITGAYDQP
jgi:hypothetical protein